MSDNANSDGTLLRLSDYASADKMAADPRLANAPEIRRVLGNSLGFLLPYECAIETNKIPEIEKKLDRIFGHTMSKRVTSGKLVLADEGFHYSLDSRIAETYYLISQSPNITEAELANFLDNSIKHLAKRNHILQQNLPKSPAEAKEYFEKIIREATNLRGMHRVIGSFIASSQDNADNANLLKAQNAEKEQRTHNLVDELTSALSVKYATILIEQDATEADKKELVDLFVANMEDLKPALTRYHDYLDLPQEKIEKIVSEFDFTQGLEGNPAAMADAAFTALMDNDALVDKEEHQKAFDIIRSNTPPKVPPFISVDESDIIVNTSNTSAKPLETQTPPGQQPVTEPEEAAEQADKEPETTAGQPKTTAGQNTTKGRENGQPKITMAKVDKVAMGSAILTTLVGLWATITGSKKETRQNPETGKDEEVKTSGITVKRILGIAAIGLGAFVTYQLATNKMSFADKLNFQRNNNKGHDPNQRK